MTNLLPHAPVSVQHNFQPLYVRLVNEFKDPTIQRKVLSTTYHYVRTLLGERGRGTQVPVG